MKAVDLLSSAPRADSRPRIPLGAAALGLVLVLALSVTAAVYLHVEGTVTGNEEQVAGLRRQLTLAKQASRELPSVGGSPAASQLREAVLATLGGRESWGGILRGVGRVMPQGVWLTKLSLSGSGASVEASAGGATQAGPPTQAALPIPTALPQGAAPERATLSLTGCALDQALVGRAVSGLNRLPGASEASVSSSQGAAGRGSSCRGYPSFQLSLGLVGSAS